VDTLETVVRYLYLAAAACFVVGLHLMNTPATARRGNLLSATAMAAAAAGTVTLILARGTATTWAWIVIVLAAGLGAAVGVHAARTVPMTGMPQLVSLFNAVGGGAAALLAAGHIATASEGTLGARVTVPGALDILVGAVAFAGSLVAAGKLQGWVPGRPILFPGARLLTAACGVAAGAGAIWLVAVPSSLPALLILVTAGLGFAVVMVLPIGGADAPVVISLLNAATGIAVALAGFVLDEPVLIIGGGLVGASGSILTKLMADAMNRSIPAIVLGGFGTGDGPPTAAAADARVRTVSVDDVAIQLAYAQRVVIVPGYGLAAAQAQHELAAVAGELDRHGVEVGYAIHPVAGRMPGHMDVLLAEANVPYPQLLGLEEANQLLPRTDVALVVGANDVTNPAARRPGNPVSGMPILDVDRAAQVVVIKRSLGHGYAGIDNELYADPRTGMLFADAKRALTDLLTALRAYIPTGG
jgi:NAD(P) transhydrogenase subunit beta